MKKSHVKKIAALTLAGCVACMNMMLSGCGKNEEEANAGDTKTFSYWVTLPGQIATTADNYNDVLMYQQREKDSGIHIEFIHPSASQVSEQFNLMIASGEVPDMIEYNWMAYPGGPQKAIEDKIIIPLNDYIDKYAPNFKKAMTDRDELSPFYARESKTDNGDYFAFPNLNVGTARIFAGPLIRKDWLDELGLPVPETIDEWTTALKAFKEKKGAKAPLSATNEYFSTVNSFNGAFNVGQRLYLDGDKVKFGPMEDGYKDYLTLMNNWYKEGLIDRDYATNQRPILDTKMISGEAGSTFLSLGAGLGVYLNQMKEKDPDYNLVCAPYPVLNKGDKNNFSSFEGDVVDMSVAITTSCKDPVAAVKWLDYWYSEEGYKLLNFGVEGESYNMVDGKPVYTDDILHNPNGMSVNTAISMACRATLAAPGFRQAPEYLEQYYQFPQQTEGFKLWAENVDGVRKTSIPKSLSPTIEESEEYAALSADITTYVDEMCLKFVSGEEPIENYDEFRSTLKSQFNTDRYLEIAQNMYNRYLER